MTEPTTTTRSSPDAEAATFRIWTGIPILSLVYYTLGMWLDSPILIMAGRSRMFGARAKWWHRLIWAVAPFAIVLFPAGAIFIVAILGGVLTLVLAGSAIAGEKEKQTLEALFVTPLSSARIIFDKFVLAVCPALLLQAFALLGIILALALGMAPPWMLFSSHILLLATLPALGAIGVFCSSRSRNTVTGVIAALLAGWLWTLVGRFIVPLILFFVERASSDILMSFLPVALLIAAQLLIAYVFFRLTVRHLHALRSGRKAAMPLFAEQ